MAHSYTSSTHTHTHTCTCVHTHINGKHIYPPHPHPHPVTHRHTLTNICTHKASTKLDLLVSLCSQSSFSSKVGFSSGHQCPTHWAWSLRTALTWCWNPVSKHTQWHDDMFWSCQQTHSDMMTRSDPVSKHTVTWWHILTLSANTVAWWHVLTLSANIQWHDDIFWPCQQTQWHDDMFWPCQQTHTVPWWHVLTLSANTHSQLYTDHNFMSLINGDQL